MALVFLSSCFGESPKSLETDCNELATIKIEELTHQKTFRKAIRIIEDGSDCALRFQFSARAYFANAPSILEELDIAVGKVIKKRPKIFLKALKEYGKSTEFDGLLCNLGDEYVDEFNKQLIEIDLRIKAIRSVKESELVEIQDKCLNVLNSHRTEIIQIINEIDTNQSNQKTK
jgi:hypothetical protein